uniref:MEG 1 n=1 Tax=Schistosoma mansoni TaxID=6183 RepID=A0A3Q0KJW1_SCHMA
MPRICTLNYFILCSGVVITSNQLDEKLFPYSKRFNGSACVTKDGKVTCTESTHQSLSDSFRRFMIFKCSLILLALCSLAIIRHRHKRLDKKLMQKVNFQIAAGV